MKGDIRYQLRLGNHAYETLTNEAAEIVVNESMQDASTCSVKVPVDICNGKYKYINDEDLVPGREKLLSVVAWIDGTQSVLFHGPITGRKVDLKHGGSGSTLEITATDKRVQLDRQCRKYESHSGTVDQVVKRLLKTLKHCTPDVESFDKIRYRADSGPLNQTVSDLTLIRQLAAAVSAEFWLDWKLSGESIVETAHFASRPKRNDSKGFGIPISIPLISPKKSVLKLNTGDAKTSLLSFNSDRKTEVPQQSGVILRVDPRTGEIKNSMVNAPSTKPLGDAPPQPEVTNEVLSAGGVESARDKAEAAINDASWFVEAQAETSVFALGDLLRPRAVVTVDGVGKPDEGDYLIWSVNHRITPTEHQMQLTLRRNAVGGK